MPIFTKKTCLAHLVSRCFSEILSPEKCNFVSTLGLIYSFYAIFYLDIAENRKNDTKMTTTDGNVIAGIS
jgi:hypothetical protein